MSGDLISRETLLEDIRNNITECSGIMGWLKLINSQPVAYDVDKVVEKLENKRKEAVLKAPAYAGLHDKQFQKWMMKSFGFEEAIEIVKAERSYCYGNRCAGEADTKENH